MHPMHNKLKLSEAILYVEEELFLQAIDIDIAAGKDPKKYSQIVWEAIKTLMVAGKIQAYVWSRSPPKQQNVRWQGEVIPPFCCNKIELDVATPDDEIQINCGRNLYAGSIYVNDGDVLCELRKIEAIAHGGKEALEAGRPQRAPTHKATIEGPRRGRPKNLKDENALRNIITAYLAKDTEVTCIDADFVDHIESKITELRRIGQFSWGEDHWKKEARKILSDLLLSKADG
jgi:hypothetical protein